MSEPALSPVNAHTDPDTGLRYYDWQGEQYPSVTSIRKLIGMPFPLHNWTLTKVVDRAVAESAVMVAMLNRPRRKRERVRDSNALRETKAWLRKAATEERDRHGDRGDRIHQAVKAHLPSTAVDPDIAPFIRQYEDFRKRSGLTMLWQERQVFNLSYRYAGSADFLGVLRDGRIAVGDVKSGNSIYLDHAVQCMAYAMGEFVGENDVVDSRATALLQKAEAMVILHLTETGWELAEIRPDPILFKAFVGALAFALALETFDNRLDNLIINRMKGAALVPLTAGKDDDDSDRDT